MLFAVLVTALLWQPCHAAIATVSVGTGTLELPVGQTAPLVVHVSDIQGLYGFEIHLSFDPTVVEVIDADPNTSGVQIGPGDFLSPDFVVQDRADNQAGTVDFVVTQLNPTEAKSGSGTLLTLSLRGLAANRTSQVAVTKSKFANRNGEVIPVTIVGGEVSVRGAVAPGSSPTLTPTPSPTALSSSTATPTVRPTATPTRPAAEDRPPPTATRAGMNTPLPVATRIATDTPARTATAAAAGVPPVAATPTQVIVLPPATATLPAATDASPAPGETPTRVAIPPSPSPMPVQLASASPAGGVSTPILPANLPAPEHQPQPTPTRSDGSGLWVTGGVLLGLALFGGVGLAAFRLRGGRRK